MRMRQSNRTNSRLAGLGFMAVLAALIIGPQLGFIVYALATPAVRATIAEQPMMALEIALALTFWIGLVIWPLRDLLLRLARNRTVEISETTVSAADTHVFGTKAWTAPLSEYRGIAHHIRTSLSVARHELVLVHPDAKRSVLLRVSDNISEAETERMARLLGLPRIAASELYYAFAAQQGRAAAAKEPQAAPKAVAA